MSEPTGVPYLEVDLEHAVGDFQLRVSLSIGQPWTVLFGPSGAGKSTLLRILSGLVTPNRGRITLGGHTLLDTNRGIFVPAGRRAIGFLTQEPSLFPHLDVGGNITFGLHKLTPGEQARRLDAMLGLFRIENLARRRPSEISGGERQRAALARALAPEPRILLLDEPFAALDAELKDSILTSLTRWLDDRQIPAVYVSHDVAEAYQTAAEVVVLRAGQICAHGAGHTVLAEERQRLLRQLGADEFQGSLAP